MAADSAPGNGLWSGSGAGGLMPGWLPSEGLLPLKGDEQGSEQGRDSAGGKGAKKDVGAAAAAAAAAGAGAADRGGKAKKRGGTSNRGKGETKASHTK